MGGDRGRWEGTVRGSEGEGEVGTDRDVLRDREQWGRTGRGGEGQRAVARDRERFGGTGSSGEGQVFFYYLG